MSLRMAAFMRTSLDRKPASVGNWV